jgi:hypothetical protein
MNNTIIIIIMSYTIRCSSVEIHGTMYKRGCWLITGKNSFCGVYHPQFSQLKDILSKGENRAPFFVIASASVIEYLPHQRAHLVCLMSSIVSIIHPSSLVYHEPVSSVCKGGNFILKSRVDLSPFLNN